ncbi:TauD/TfdA family dioxygenase [Sporosarcina sp. GW1-11]|uniref:TauD/TfdA family dioxygenase n=1 Tax=Sporosarcina sp. GW1-11 TaxID=2899126 RepID=UPI00294FA422|nr:TauD/TfdA family dioxygenase [Sporosarcina sp. GW1-11]MDV6379468.1 TauD/TfdA family dioxygenase [Sporosarcina sp. GW1-11]
MGVILKEKVQGASAWKGKDLLKDDSWIYYWSDEAIASLENALEQVKQKGLQVPNFTKEEFPIPELANEIASFNDELENGRGFLLLRGLPIERYTDEEAAIIYYGIGLHMGTPVSQNVKGDMLGHVRNIGKLDTKNVRVYETNENLPYHADLSDVVGLLSLRKAKSGGLSSLASGMTLYNEILEKHPEYIGILYRLFLMEHLDDGKPGLTPIFSYHDGKLSGRYMRQYIEIAQENAGFPLSKVEIEALDLVDSIMNDEDLRIDMMLEPGDMQFANNYTVFHSRTAFEDYEDVGKRRHLLRLWLKMPNARELAPDFPGRNGIAKREEASEVVEA